MGFLFARNKILHFNKAGDLYSFAINNNGRNFNLFQIRHDWCIKILPWEYFNRHNRIDFGGNEKLMCININGKPVRKGKCWLISNFWGELRSILCTTFNSMVMYGIRYKNRKNIQSTLNVMGLVNVQCYQWGSNHHCLRSYQLSYRHSRVCLAYGGNSGAVNFCYLQRELFFRTRSSPR